MGGVSKFSENTYGIVKRLVVFQEWIKNIREKLGEDQLSILDFGCGIGTWVTLPLASEGDLIHGVDLHSASIKLAAKKKYF